MLPGAGGAAGFGANIAAFMTSPAGIAAAVALAGVAIHKMTNDPDNYTRASAGFLTAPTPGAAPGQTFSVPAFASGFKPIGFADKKSQQDAIAQIENFRKLDQELVDLINASGGFVNMSRATLAGVGADGRAGTSGTFLGLGGKTTAADLAAMADSYAHQLVKHIDGLTPDTMAKLAGASNASEITEILKALTETNKELKKGVEDLTAAIDLSVDNYLKDIAIGGGQSELSKILTFNEDQQRAQAWENAQQNFQLERQGYSFSTGRWTPRPLLSGTIGGDLMDVPRYATGANSITRDGLGYLHAGEEVKPKRFVDQDRDARSETNSLLLELLNKDGDGLSARDIKILLSMMERSQSDMTQIIKTWEVNGMPAERV
jgi:hypothetical protein